MNFIKAAILVCTLSLFSSISRAQVSAERSFKKLEWLIGSWKRTNAKPGQTGFESWTRKSAYSLLGKGFTLKGVDTVFSENLKLIIKSNDIFYVVEGADNQGPVFFKVTQLTEKSFVCENPGHDFPKKISYRFSGRTINATISGNGQSIDFNFVKEE